MPKILLAACVLLLSAAPALAQDGAPAGGGSSVGIALPTSIHIDEALLGSVSPGCDVTQDIKRRCEGRTHCEIVVSKDLCLTRRLPGLLQPLHVGYHCRVGELPRSVTADEPNRLQLLCVSNPSRKD
jgi:hypothetical protein